MTRAPGREPAAGLLAVPGADLYYEIRGAGPALLLIPTGNGDAGPYAPLADALADRHTVITYDRRGYSRSPMHAPVDGARRVAVDARDASLLIERLAAGPAAALGGSSGAVVALALLERHPDTVRTLVAHEPPLASVLPDAAEWRRFYADLYDTYRRIGARPARAEFRARMGMTGDTRPPEEAQPPPAELERMLGRIRGNLDRWFEEELRPYPSYPLDTAALGRVAGRLVLAGGRDSRDHHPYEPNTVLAKRFGLDIADFPGGHVGYVTHPFEFAERLAEVLAGAR
uniref:Acetyltransferase/esterase n=1 Tax=Actinomadura madurae TaxID=1993 RepID=B0BLM8_9ACTN|nr:acetyltransferase/esterase [Actinomadura madurae]